MVASPAQQGFGPALLARKSSRGVPVYALFASTVGGVIASLVNFVAPDSGIFEFIMNSAGLVALFVYVFIALTQRNLRRAMTPEQVADLKLKVWFFPWLNVVLIGGVLFVLVVMMGSESGRTQVYTSLMVTVAMMVLWPLARKKALNN